LHGKMAINELRKDQGRVVVDMIDVFLNNAALNHRLVPFSLLKMAVSKAAADEGTAGVAFLTRPPQAAKTACSPRGLR